jgi:predicted amidohydrolase
MDRLCVSVVPSLSPPPEAAQLVLFSAARNYVAEYDSGRMLAAAACYAMRHKVYLVPERFVAADSLCLCLLSPKGEVLGVQRATHLNLDYRGRFFRDDAIRPFDTPFGRAALLVDVDVNTPQVARAAVEDGATLLLSSQFIQLFDFFEDRIRYGAVNAAASNGVPVAAAAGSGAVVVGCRGELLAGFSEDLRLTVTVDLRDTADDREAIAAGRRLLLAHRSIIVEETEVIPGV